MKYVETYRIYETDDAKKDDDQVTKQNDFDGFTPGGLSLFEDDVTPSKGSLDTIPGYNFAMCSTKIGLWTLEGKECHLVGIGSPFQRSDYVDYLETLPREVGNLLLERMEFYALKEDGSLLFGINNTIRVLQARPDDGLYYVVYPDGSIEMCTNFNTTLHDEVTVGRLEKWIGMRIYSWLKTRFPRIINQQ